MTAKPVPPPKPKALVAGERTQLVAASSTPISQSRQETSQEVALVISSPIPTSVRSNPQVFYGPAIPNGFKNYGKNIKNSPSNVNGIQSRRASMPDDTVHAVAPSKDVKSRVKAKVSQNSAFTSYAAAPAKSMDSVDLSVECGKTYAEAKRKFTVDTSNHASKNLTQAVPGRLPNNYISVRAANDRRPSTESYLPCVSSSSHLESEVTEDLSNFDFCDREPIQPNHSINEIAVRQNPPQIEMGAEKNVISSQPESRNSVISTGTVSSASSHDLHDSDAENQRSVPKAEKVAAEIVSSERHYLQTLRLLLTDFPSAVQGSVPMEEVNQLLKGLPQIEKLSEDLYEDLRAHLHVYPTDRQISPVFLKKGKVLLLYVSYVNDFEKLIDTYRNLQRKYPRFAELVATFENSSVCKKIRLVEYFHQPIQRLCRYPLLLASYLRSLEDDHPDRENTKLALDLVSDVTAKANTTVTSLEKVHKLLWYQARTVGYTFLRSNRVFIRDGILKKLSRKAPQDRTILLCSDALICGEFDSITGMKFTVNAEYLLTEIKVEPLIDSEYFDRALEFGVYSTKEKSFVFQANSLEERNSWLSAISRALEERQKQQNALPLIRRTQIADAPAFAPIWIPDYRVQACQLCRKSFHVFRRYHHCRLCGYAVCGDCSPHEIEIEYKDNRNKRVCIECFHDPSKNPGLRYAGLPHEVTAKCLSACVNEV